MKWAPIFFLYKDCLAPSFNVVDVLQGKTFEHEHYRYLPVQEPSYLRTKILHHYRKEY